MMLPRRRHDAEAAYHLIHPATATTCVVFASPHRAGIIRWSFLRRRSERTYVRSSEDAFVDQLFEPRRDMARPLLKAGAPRAFVDLNRGADELDPALIEGVRRNGHNPRVASGLG